MALIHSFIHSFIHVMEEFSSRVLYLQPNAPFFFTAFFQLMWRTLPANQPLSLMINAILKLSEIQNSGKKTQESTRNLVAQGWLMYLLDLQLPLRSLHLLYLEQKIISASLLIIFFLLLNNFFFLIWCMMSTTFTQQNIILQELP